MAETAWIVLVFAASFGGFAFLALSQKRHWRTVLRGEAPEAGQVRILRAAGSLGLAISLFAAVLRDGLSFGILLWVLGMSVTAFCVALTLTWRPGWLKPLTRFYGG